MVYCTYVTYTIYFYHIPYTCLGQFIASSPTLFPAEYVLEFQSCLDQSTTVPYTVIKQIIQQDLKRDPVEVFSYIDSEPLASASIAQVRTCI